MVDVVFFICGVDFVRSIQNANFASYRNSVTGYDKGTVSGKSGKELRRKFTRQSDFGHYYVCDNIGVSCGNLFAKYPFVNHIMVGIDMGRVQFDFSGMLQRGNDKRSRFFYGRMRKLQHYRSAFAVVKGVGIALIFVAFVLLQRKTDDKKVNAVWIVLTVATMLAAGFSNVIMSVFKTLPVASERNLLIIVGNAVSALLSILCALIVGVAKKAENKLILNPVPKNALLFAILSGVTLAVYQPLSMLALTMVDVSLYYPVTGALAVIFLMVIGIPVFKDKPSVKQIIGACVGLCAIVLLNLQNI